ATTAGGFGVKVRSADDLPRAVKSAFEHNGPAIVDVDVNPDEPPMPAKVTYEQAKSFALAFLRGQPHKASIASTLFRDKLRELRQ
ncbi:MAG TPA: pyruvate oxidase, partial [Acidimicrobiia bacterium]